MRYKRNQITLQLALQDVKEGNNANNIAVGSAHPHAVESEGVIAAVSAAEGKKQIVNDAAA